ncbi:hypothetical protein BABINDRAFT_168086 [Babjeviella inositovora NRRL Y-12698]|uniref:Prefoldin subunit 3 n=1 Tax=Babjeviella inositovora NRRL Y-12698 TaxID=984486 RepID=A0A1E3QMI0_9ASCO|nr:uncharacterized protein BABINDRAFT_168086 [Babjeviella inositovora NRRL Y-12698]ODQ78916.1 hypothetical protein BABINDRAFT_168086 [Babjeviella inositovora NRRL Y-12698]
MSARFFAQTDETNPRGIPASPFLSKIEDFVTRDADFEDLMNKFQERIQQYKYMETSKQSSKAGLNAKIPDITKSLSMVKHLQALQDSDDVIECNYELNDTLYTKAEIAPKEAQSVFLWLGADVMLEYPLEEAHELLAEKLAAAESQLAVVGEDLEFLRENITTMEVNTARLYNWDVVRRRELREAEEKAKNLKI